MVKQLTSGSPRRLLFTFALPLLIGNLFQQIYNITDTAIVGRVVGLEALAAVGSVGSTLFLVMGFAQAATAGLTIPLAQRFGANDEDGVRRSFTVATLVSLVIAAVITLLGTVFASEIIALLQTPADMTAYATDYLRVVFAGAVFTVAYNLLANVLRALGDSRTPLYFLVLAAMTNLVLDLVFMVGFGWGVAGAGLATVISQGVSALCCLVFIHRKVPALHASRANWRVTGADVWAHTRLGLPMGFQASIIALGSITIQVALNQMGSETVAAYTAAQRIEQLAMLPFVSFGIAMGTYAAQNYGAGLPGRVWDGVRATALMSLVYGVVIGLVLWFFSDSLVGAFIKDAPAEVERMGQLYFWVTVPFYPALILLFIYRYTLQGLGHSLVPTLAGFIELGMRVLTAFFIAPVYGYVGVLVCHPLAWVGAWAILALTYRRVKATV